MNKRLAPKDRAELILAAAFKLAQRQGFQKLTRESIAKAAGVSDALVSHAFGGMEKLRVAVITKAVADECLPLVAAGIIAKIGPAVRAPLPLRKRAMASLA